jgi:ElaB/YqjD/DUF883 family membrane-anchored ribosome-binding protein
VTQPVDVAYVDIVARTRNFRRELKDVVEKDGRRFERELEEILDGVERDLRDVADEADRSFTAMGDAADDAAAILNDVLGDALDDITEKVTDLGDEIDVEFERSFRNFSDAWDEFDRRGRGEAALERLRGGLEALVDGVGAAGRALGSGLTSAIIAIPALFLPILLGLPLLIDLFIALGAVVTDAAGALALLPGALAVLAAIIAPLVIGFNGFGEAIGAVLEKDPDKIAEALKELAPAARSVVLEFQKLMPIFTNIGDVVQQQLFTPLVGDLTRLVAAVRGPLLAGLAAVATSLGNIISDFAVLFSQPESVEAIAAVFATTAEILEILRPGITAFSAGLRDIIVASLPFLEQFATLLSGLAEDFGAFLSEAVKTGDFKSFMDSALTSLKALGGLVLALVKFFGALFTPEVLAAGQIMLFLFTELLNIMTGFLQTTAGQRFLEDLALLAVAAAGALSGLILVLGFVFASITLFVGEVVRLFTGLDDVIDRWQEETTRAADAVVGVIGAVPAKIEAFAAKFAQAGLSLINSFIGGFRKTGNFIGDVAGDIVGAVRGGLNKLINSINAGIGQLDALLPFSLSRIPQLASGGIVPARPGGFLANIAEGGEEEVVAPLSDLEDMIAENAGGTTINFGPASINITFDGVVPTEDEARRTGEAVGRGVAGALTRRGIQLQVRAI